MAGLKIYNYNWATGAYISAEWADVSPLEPDKWIIPAHATPKAPPQAEPGYSVRFDREADEWVPEKLPPPATAAPDLVNEDLTIGDLFNANR
jgi:hypothetical protein